MPGLTDKVRKPLNIRGVLLWHLWWRKQAGKWGGSWRKLVTEQEISDKYSLLFADSRHSSKSSDSLPFLSSLYCIVELIYKIIFNWQQGMKFYVFTECYWLALHYSFTSVKRKRKKGLWWKTVEWQGMIIVSLCVHFIFLMQHRCSAVSLHVLCFQSTWLSQTESRGSFIHLNVFLLVILFKRF